MKQAPLQILPFALTVLAVVLCIFVVVPISAWLLVNCFGWIFAIWKAVYQSMGVLFGWLV